MIELKNISVTFQQKKQEIQAVQDVSLTIDKGDIYGIVGYSGAGKSTLVRVINLLQRPTAGTVIINKENILTFLTKLKSVLLFLDLTHSSLHHKVKFQDHLLKRGQSQPAVFALLIVDWGKRPVFHLVQLALING